MYIVDHIIKQLIRVYVKELKLLNFKLLNLKKRFPYFFSDAKIYNLDTNFMNLSKSNIAHILPLFTTFRDERVMLQHHIRSLLVVA